MSGNRRRAADALSSGDAPGITRSLLPPVTRCAACGGRGAGLVVAHGRCAHCNLRGDVAPPGHETVVATPRSPRRGLAPLALPPPLPDVHPLAALEACRGCRGRGVGLSLEDGYCGHCRRTAVASGGGPGASLEWVDGRMQVSVVVSGAGARAAVPDERAPVVTAVDGAVAPIMGDFATAAGGRHDEPQSRRAGDVRCRAVARAARDACRWRCRPCWQRLLAPDRRKTCYEY